MRFQILGPLGVRMENDTLRPTGPRQRATLAFLLFRANRVVPFDEIIDAVWEHRPPATVHAQLQAQVSHLRGMLRRVPGQPARIITSPAGYRLDVDPAEIDGVLFEADLRRGRELVAEGRPEQAGEVLRRALALWRGRPFGGVRVRFAEAAATRLEDLRLAALELRVDADLRLGRHAVLVPELVTLVEQYPLREELRRQLLLALHRSGRRADALAAYEKGRRLLREELGLEPAPELTRVRDVIVAAPPAAPQSARPADAPPAPVIRCRLPPVVPDFVGRATELASATALLGPAAGEHTVLVVHGRPGVGKSAFAVHLAHLTRAARPDFQLHARLHEAQRPVTPHDVLGRLLRDLGVHAEALPSDTEERGHLFRLLLADRRALLVLDDAADEDQVRPLLPGTAGCAVVVTARTTLGGLVGARWLNLDVMSTGDAMRLLVTVAGSAGTAVDPEAAEGIVRSVGRLPLAVRVAGARLATQPWLTASRLRAALDRAQGRIDELAAGDLALRPVLASSSDRLAPAIARALGLLGSAMPRVFSAGMAGLLLDLPVEAARAVVAKLVDAHLIDRTADDEYRFHPLIREYARERVPHPPCADRSRRTGERGGDGRRCGVTCVRAPNLATPARPPGTVQAEPLCRVDAE